MGIMNEQQVANEGGGGHCKKSAVREVVDDSTAAIDGTIGLLGPTTPMDVQDPPATKSSEAVEDSAAPMEGTSDMPELTTVMDVADPRAFTNNEATESQSNEPPVDTSSAAIEVAKSQSNENSINHSDSAAFPSQIIDERGGKTAKEALADIAFNSVIPYLKDSGIQGQPLSLYRIHEASSPDTKTPALPLIKSEMRPASPNFGLQTPSPDTSMPECGEDDDSSSESQERARREFKE